ncbi:hypothetical protein LPB140_00900 [Sphingorhabdus lutea]|uniref:UPF0314 protein LPB140_00900 n=1 Tax=Sphingorhabdus lutea TaxID=1913578 RepID=A0A1L3J962_9SPHN|nr:DUF2585 domain-containing protein [Sphingorhabdus lutea]APG61633.1 hypothetical protein LPB140_00900 [Sphingorhabdus lutea]
MRWSHKKGWIAALAIAAITLIILLLMNRPLICACGTVKLWHGVVQSSQNSQHIADWYMFSHIIHGFLFYALAWMIFRRHPNLQKWALPLAVLIESGWEILENTPLIIDRYREVTISWGYAGDSIINSMSDIGWMTLGFILAARFPVKYIIATAIIFELFTLYMIRDNLTLNILMLIAPVESIAAWQAGG